MQEPRHRGQTDEERDRRRHQELRARRAHALQHRVKRVRQREQPGREHRRNRQQEPEAGGQFALLAEEQAGADRRPGPETPGTSAKVWAMPTTTASRQVSCSAPRLCFPTRSASAITAENTTSAVAITHRLRTPERISSLNSRPSTQIGIVPMMTYQPSR